MALKSMNSKILLNAEAFGFGPTAAVASFFPSLRASIGTLGYIGEGHTLDLQEPLPYDAIYNCEGWRNSVIMAIMERYDVFVTACDFKMAELAKRAGLKVVIYDPLTWFSRDMPEAIKHADLYLAQNFVGVAEALQTYLPHMAGNAVIVPPMLQEQQPHRMGDLVLLNFGGLLNPFWALSDAIHYAKEMHAAVKAALPADAKLLVCASSAIAKALPEMGAQSYAREDMLALMAQAKLAFMTSGLGNIYDAAHFNLPTVWLPPTNDTQGQQLELIAAKNMVDAHLNWEALDYKAPQAEVMQHIVKRVHGLNAATLAPQMAAAYAAVKGKAGSKAAGLIARYGSGGAEAVAEHIVNFIHPQQELRPCA